MPTFSADDYVDYCVREAVAVRVGKQRDQAKKDARRQEWRSDHADWAKKMGLV